MNPNEAEAEAYIVYDMEACQDRTGHALPDPPLRKGGMVGVNCGTKPSNKSPALNGKFPRGHPPEPHTAKKKFQFPRNTAPALPATPAVAAKRQTPAHAPAAPLLISKNKDIREWLDTLIKIRARVQALQRDIWIATSRPNIKEEMSFADYRVVDTIIEDEKRKMAASIGQIRDMAISLVGHITHVTSGNAYIEQLRTLMHSIETALLAFKETQRDKFEGLLRDEKRLTSELAGHEERIIGWDGPSRPDTAHDVAGTSTKLVSRIKATLLDNHGSLPEAQAFQDYVARYGGHYGGWDDLTHSAFVKLYKKYPNSNVRLVEAVMSNIPGINVESAMIHYQWYGKYLELLAARKEAIRKWKEQKVLAKQYSAHSIELSADQDVKLTERDREEEARLREQKRKEVEEWKASRKIKQEDEEREREATARRAAEDAAKKTKQHEKVKALVMERAQRKVAEEEQRKQEAEEAGRLRKHTAALSTDDIKRIQQRDQEVLSRRKELLDRRKREDEEKEKRLNKLRSTVEIHVQRDPDRLFKPTEGFLKKHEKKEEDEAGLHQSMFQNVHIPRRTVPTWRQGI
ncbi:hypothetical protein SeLEV6574_g00797 [Synchytrium endobioticum]|uniref:Coiled-coil domain-containing protein 112 n=1 Tax=Synchytrium endobioticum TaxID=286115 RepID=A0A507DIA0_9FUNG|nr:hypothetical protein SeLEV6574_g00797 [Synchytrium endobioticum]